MRHHRIKTILLAAAMAMSLTACSQEPADSQEEQPKEPAGIAVQVETVAADTIATENKVSGKLSADTETPVMVAATAKCTAVYKEAGDTVRAGEVICKVDLGSTVANYSAAQIGYTSAQQAYEDQKGILDRQVKLAEDNVANTKALFEIGAASQLEVDQAELNYQTAVAGRTSALAQLEAGIQSAKSGLEQLNLVLDNVDLSGNVIAPASGTLASLTAVEGSYISASMPVAVIDGAEQMKLTVSVSEALVPKLSIGDEAEAYVSAADQVFPAVIRSVERTANMQTKLYTVVLSVPADVEGLLSGMSADVTFRTNVTEQAIVVPTEAILTSNDIRYVFVVENGTAKRVDVTVGLAGSGVTEVTSGLTAGQQLVTVGQAYLTDGDPVRIVAGED